MKNPRPGRAGAGVRRGAFGSRLADDTGDEGFEFDDVFGEVADAFGGFLGGHGVFVEEPAEGFFVAADAVDFEGLGVGGVEFGGDGVGGGLEFAEETGGDGEQVAASEFGDLPFVAEAGAHDLGGVAEVLVVVVDLGDRLDAGVFGSGVVFAGALFVPVEDAADEGGDQFDAAFSAGDGLGEGEEEGQVAVDAFFLEDFSGFDAFPGGGDFDEDALAGDAGFFVHADEVTGFVDVGLGVEGEAGVDFGGDAAGDDFEDFEAEGDDEAVHDGVEKGGAGEGGGFAVGDGFFDEGLVFVFLGGLEDEGGVGGGVLGFVGLHGFEVSGVGDDGRVLFELVELVHKARVLLRLLGLAK